MNYERLNKTQIAKIQKIEKLLKEANAEIKKLGFNAYLANDTLNIMKGPSHSADQSPKPLHENIMHSILLQGWDGGDW